MTHRKIGYVTLVHNRKRTTLTNIIKAHLKNLKVLLTSTRTILVYTSLYRRLTFGTKLYDLKSLNINYKCKVNTNIK